MKCTRVILSPTDKPRATKMVDYVRGSEYDNWHWCKNCTQYPMYIYQKTPLKPPSNLCNQCKAKNGSGNCQYEELKRTDPERELKREIPNPCYAETL